MVAGDLDTFDEEYFNSTVTEHIILLGFNLSTIGLFMYWLYAKESRVCKSYLFLIA